MPQPPAQPAIASIAAAADRLRAGGVVAFPTETVYGLGADALNADAVDRVFALKGRPRNNPMIVHVRGPEMARRVVAPGAWSDRAETLARTLWPGPISLLLPRSPALPRAVTAGGPLVAVRCPNHPVALALLFELNRPLVGPSANLSGHVSPTTAAHVRESFAESDVLVLDGGPCEAGIESTVLDIAADPPRILRPGIISAPAIAAILNCDVVTSTATRPASSSEPLASPGLLDRHYAPRTRALMFDPAKWPGVLDDHQRAVVLTPNSRAAPAPHSVIRMPASALEYAAALYSALREADRATPPPQVILIERPARDDDPLWEAVFDRLSRATA